MNIPRKEFFRYIYCQYCGIQKHAIFYIHPVTRNKEIYLRFHKKCLKCNKGNLDEIHINDFYALIKNEYL